MLDHFNTHIVRVAAARRLARHDLDLVAAGGEDALVELEVQARRLREVARAQLTAHLLDVVFEDVQLLGGHHPGCQATGEALQSEAQLKGIGGGYLSSERPDESTGGLHFRRLLDEHALAGLHADQAQRTER